MSDDSGILCEFECPVCFQYMHPPIHTCDKGHCICKTCKPKVTNCPQCRSSSFYRCFAMERIHSKLKFPCKYDKDGCQITTFDFANIEEHETLCLYNSTRTCPLAQNPCNWNGKYGEMLKHIQDKHSRLIASEDTFVAPLDSSATKIEIAFIKKYDHVFQIILNRNLDFSEIVVQFVGSPDEAEKYTYKTEIFKNKKKSWIITEGCEKLESFDRAFEDDKGVSISEGKLQQFYDSNSKITISILCELGKSCLNDLKNIVLPSNGQQD